jgi:hypothetical protein
LTNNSNNTSTGNQLFYGEYFGVTPLPEAVETTMAYIPFQTNTTEYTPETALKSGTLFADLNKPFYGGKCK